MSVSASVYILKFGHFEQIICTSEWIYLSCCLVNMIFSKSASSSMISKFAKLPCSARPRTVLRLHLITLLCLLLGNVAEEAIDYSLNGSGWPISSTEDSSIIIRWCVYEIEVSPACLVLQSCVDRLSELILPVTCSCFIADSHSI